MRLSLQFPLHTKSENELRSLPFAVARLAKTKGVKAANGLAIAIAQRTARQRAEVRKILDSHLPRMRRELPTFSKSHWLPNFFRVTMIRISAGVLDDDGLAGALKHVQDEIAAWLGIDDGPRGPVRWQRAQQRGPRSVYAVRIEIEDDDPDPREILKIVGPPIGKLGPVLGQSYAPALLEESMSRERGTRPGTDRIDGPGATVPQISRRLGMTERQLREFAPKMCQRMDREYLAQEPLRFRRSYYAPAGQDEEADDVTLEELTGQLFDATEPPLRIIKGGRALVRRQDFHPALGEHWIYEPAQSAARATDE